MRSNDRLQQVSSPVTSPGHRGIDCTPPYGNYLRYLSSQLCIPLSHTTKAEGIHQNVFKPQLMGISKKIHLSLPVVNHWLTPQMNWCMQRLTHAHLNTQKSSLTTSLLHIMKIQRCPRLRKIWMLLWTYQLIHIWSPRIQENESLISCSYEMIRNGTTLTLKNHIACIFFSPIWSDIKG